MTVETHSSSVSGSEDTTTTAPSTATMNPGKPKKVNENTLLTPAQTYFADEKIQIPETDVSSSNKFKSVGGGGV